LLANPKQAGLLMDPAFKVFGVLRFFSTKSLTITTSGSEKEHKSAFYKWCIIEPVNFHWS